MNICFYRHSLLSRGGDKMVVEYANYLGQQGHDVVILTNKINTVFQLMVRTKKISKFRHKVNTIFNAMLLRKNYDIIIADIIVMVFFLLFKNKKRLIYFAQDYDEAYYKNFFLKFLIRAIYYLCLSVFKVPVIAVSEELGHIFQSRYRADVNVVKNGVDTVFFSRVSDKECATLKGRSKVILVFARSDYRKGFDTAKKVLSNFDDEIKRGLIDVWTVGENLPVPFQTRNFGFVSEDKLKKILSYSDILLYPSRHEGLPLLVLEALCCGCAVVTTTAVNLLKNGVDGLVCNIDDAECLSRQLKRLLFDDNLYKQISMRGVNTSKRYDIQTSKQNFYLAVQKIYASKSCLNLRD